ncbi:MAG: hypothetical protein LBB55_01890 [Zoogloeaceae bacterium]|jgi:hypothetical protein|nr:hypothetical protein [Zoogloeaceae bacterium]
MKKLLHLYAWLAPALLAPLSFYLWLRVYGNLPQTLMAWLIPVLWAWLVPACGTNVCKVWEFNTRLKWGRFRPHHGFVFGSATAALAWTIHGEAAASLADALRYMLIAASRAGLLELDLRHRGHPGGHPARL